MLTNTGSKSCGTMRTSTACNSVFRAKPARAGNKRMCSTPTRAANYGSPAKSKDGKALIGFRYFLNHYSRKILRSVASPALNPPPLPPLPSPPFSQIHRSPPFSTPSTVHNCSVDNRTVHNAQVGCYTAAVGDRQTCQCESLG